MGTAATFRINNWLSEPTLLVAVIGTANVPTTVGVPVMNPPEKVSPDGRLALDTVNVIGASPLAVSAYVNGVLTGASTDSALVKDGRARMVSVAVFCAPSVAVLVGLLSVSLTVALGVALYLFSRGTSNVLLASPALNMSVPETLV